MNRLKNMQSNRFYKNTSKPKKSYKNKFINNIHIKNKRIEKQIKSMIQYDILTELPNSIYFAEKLKDVLIDAEFNNKKGAVIYIDIDNCKVINDNWGYCSGNMILKMFAKLINNSVGEIADLVRLNGDEFAILIYEFNHIGEIEQICNEIYEQLKKPFKVMEAEIYITVSMGVSIFPDHSIDYNELLKFCSFAMYKSKNKGKNTYTIFNSKISDAYYRKALIKNELKNVINNDELDIFYQPQIDASSNEIIGMEALLRWNNDKLGSISPAEFIPIAENSGDIIEIGDWVLNKALRQAHIWKQKGYKFNTISVNVSPIQIKKKHFKDNLLNICSRYDILPSFVEIEITESTLVDISKDSIEVLDQLIKSGISIAIDDFGTGYSSLSYLINIPINTLKIDKIFIDNIGNYKSKVLVKGIVDLSELFKYKLIIEGVETKEQLDVLIDLGCNIIQGFYFSEPLSKNKMEDLLKIKG